MSECKGFHGEGKPGSSKKEAVKLITEEELSFQGAGRRLNLAPSTLLNWVKAHKAGRLGEVGKMQRPLPEIEMELYRVKKENAELKMERDILKKQRRTLPRSHFSVCDKRTAALLANAICETNFEYLNQRLL